MWIKSSQRPLIILYHTVLQPWTKWLSTERERTPWWHNVVEHQTQHQTDWERYELMFQSFRKGQPFIDQICTCGLSFEPLESTELPSSIFHWSSIHATLETCPFLVPLISVPRQEQVSSSCRWGAGKWREVHIYRCFWHRSRCFLWFSSLK